MSKGKRLWQKATTIGARMKTAKISSSAAWKASLNYFVPDCGDLYFCQKTPVPNVT